jgi:general secretion pathway protein D
MLRFAHQTKGVEMKLPYAILFSSFFLLSACGGTKPITTSGISPSNKHLHSTESSAPLSSGEIPQASMRAVALPPPKPSAKVETYSVVVANVPAQEILFALARDAKINLDVASGIVGTVTINAIDQTLPQILDRIAKQVDMRYELTNGTLLVMQDKPFLKTYKIDFINMARSSKSTNSTSSQISGGSSTGSAATGGNTASTIVTSDTKNDLMESLVRNVTDMLLEEDRLRFKSLKEVASSSKIIAQGDGSASSSTGSTPGKGKQANNNGEPSATGNASGSGNETVQALGGAKAVSGEFEKSVSVFANKETGVLIVRATSRQHEKVQEFIDLVMNSAKRQVLIEATIVEVTLNDKYQQGINWSSVFTGPQGWKLNQTGDASFATTIGALSATANPTTSVNLLQTFGAVKVLSSPKLTVMNNQTASLKVATNSVYFTMQSTPAVYQNGVQTSPATFTTTPASVSVGLTMSVTPQISNNNTVTLNVRPSISSLVGLGKLDPNPMLSNPCGFGVANCNIPVVESRIPEIATREMESIIRIEDGQMAVMGGLIKEEINKSSSETPLLGRIPFLGNLFRNRTDTTTKTELVIFLRPVVIKEASVEGDFSQYRDTLPTSNFFNVDAANQPINQEKQKP